MYVTSSHAPQTFGIFAGKDGSGRTVARAVDLSTELQARVVQAMPEQDLFEGVRDFPTMVCTCGSACLWCVTPVQGTPRDDEAEEPQSPAASRQPSLTYDGTDIVDELRSLSSITSPRSSIVRRAAVRAGAHAAQKPEVSPRRQKNATLPPRSRSSQHHTPSGAV